MVKCLYIQCTCIHTHKTMLNVFLQRYPTGDPARKEQVLINSRGVTVFTTNHLNEPNTDIYHNIKLIIMHLYIIVLYIYIYIYIHI